VPCILDQVSARYIMSAPPERREAIDASLGIIDEVLGRGADVLYKHYLDNQASEFSVKLAMQEMMEVVKWHFMSRDEGERDMAKNPSWIPDEEPAPATIDSWARGALRIREKPPVDESAAEVETVVTPTTQARKKRAAARKKSIAAEAEADAVDATGAAGVGDGPSGGAAGSRRGSIKVRAGPSTAERQKRKVDESKAKRAKEQATEEAQFKRIQKEMKDKDYTYDRNGSLIVIDNPDCARLPAFTVEPGVGVRSETHADKMEELRQLKAVLSASKKSTGADDSEAKLEDALRRQKQERQPSMLDSMTLTNGVTLAEAGRLKAGPQRVADTNHMSREAFAGYAGSAAPQKAGSASAPAAEASPEAAPSPPAEPTPPPADNKPNMSGMTPLKDLPIPPKLTDAQRAKLLGARNLLPRDRPNVNPNVKASQAIMPDGHSSLAAVQDHSPVGRVPDWVNKERAIHETLDNTKESTKSPTIEVNEALAKQLLGRA